MILVQCNTCHINQTRSCYFQSSPSFLHCLDLYPCFHYLYQILWSHERQEMPLNTSNYNVNLLIKHLFIYAFLSGTLFFYTHYCVNLYCVPIKNMVLLHSSIVLLLLYRELQIELQLMCFIPYLIDLINQI